MENVIEILNYPLFSNSLQSWVSALGVALFSFIVFKWVIKAVSKRFKDEAVITILNSTRSYFIKTWSLYIGASPLVLSPRIENLTDRVILVVTLIQVSIWGNQLLKLALDHYFYKRAAHDVSIRTTVGLIETLSKATFYVTLVLVALNNFGVNITALVAGLGVGGIAVALAAQSLLGDLFASLTIVLNRPFVVGDSLTVGEFSGNVEAIGLKNTRIRSVTGEEIIFANNDLLQSRLRNFKSQVERRVVHKLGVTYQTPAKTLKSIPDLVQKIVTAESHVRFDRCTLTTLGDSAIVFELVYFAAHPEFLQHVLAQEKILLNVIEAFEAHKIEFAYPTQMIFTRSLV